MNNNILTNRNKFKNKIHNNNLSMFRNIVINKYKKLRKYRKIIIDKYNNKNMDIKNIVFFHEHVNGDCYFSRTFVKNVIEGTRDMNVNYYYNSYRSLSSRCRDLGITDENFNKKIENMHYGLKHYKINDTLYLNVWIGFGLKYPLCIMCMTNFSSHYNELISEVNNSYELNINLIDTNSVSQYFIGFDYNLYNTNFLKDFIYKKKSIYKKIIVVYNCKVTSYLSLNNINHNDYLYKIANQHPEYLFVTFVNSNLQNENIISMDNICNEYNIELPNSYSTEFSYLSTVVDKVIVLMSGVSQMCYNTLNLNNKNKFLMFITNHNPAGCPLCSFSDDKLLCCSKYNLFINTLLVDKCNSEYIYNNVHEFINT
jgi:hypothetical protein